VINKSRKHVLNAFEKLTGDRKQAHAAYLAYLPNYEIYMRYSGHPPIHPIYVSTLQTQISEAHAELKRGIDTDWRVCVLQYPEILDYFYSLVSVRLPDQHDARLNLNIAVPSGEKRKNKENRKAKGKLKE
jgi:hypothetical protein